MVKTLGKGNGRQGDVLLKRVAKNLAGEKKKDGVIAQGEMTGHSHRLEGGNVLAGSNQLYVVLDKGQEATLVHEEHEHIQIQEPASFEVVRQREYNPIAERPVSD